MRTMEHTCLIGFMKLQPLKSAADFLVAMITALACDPLRAYLSESCMPFPADWPAQFYPRQVIYAPMADMVTVLDQHWDPALHGQRPADTHLVYLRNLLPMLGPLHISLNTQEQLIKQYRPIFKRLYQRATGKILPQKPRAWRIT